MTLPDRDLDIELATYFWALDLVQERAPEGVRAFATALDTDDPGKGAADDAGEASGGGAEPAPSRRLTSQFWQRRSWRSRGFDPALVAHEYRMRLIGHALDVDATELIGLCLAELDAIDPDPRDGCPEVIALLERRPRGAEEHTLLRTALRRLVRAGVVDDAARLGAVRIVRSARAPVLVRIAAFRVLRMACGGWWSAMGAAISGRASAPTDPAQRQLGRGEVIPSTASGDDEPRDALRRRERQARRDAAAARRARAKRRGARVAEGPCDRAARNAALDVLGVHGEGLLSYHETLVVLDALSARSTDPALLLTCLHVEIDLDEPIGTEIDRDSWSRLERFRLLLSTDAPVRIHRPLTWTTPNAVALVGLILLVGGGAWLLQARLLSSLLVPVVVPVVVLFIVVFIGLHGVYERRSHVAARWWPFDSRRQLARAHALCRTFRQRPWSSVVSTPEHGGPAARAAAGERAKSRTARIASALTTTGCLLSLATKVPFLLAFAGLFVLAHAWPERQERVRIEV